MTNQPLIAQSSMTRAASPAQMAAVPPGFLMWAGIYSVMFYVCSGMIAALYDPRTR